MVERVLKLCLGLALANLGCTQIIDLPDECAVDTDCEAPLYCRERLCVQRPPPPPQCTKLYGITDRDDIRYIYSTFPIVEREETAIYGKYRSCELCLAYMNALVAGNPDAEIKL